MAKRKVPEINAASMADIAFLLLVFFLVSTTMDTDKGIFRRLPPLEKPKEETFKKRNVFDVYVNKENRLLVRGELMNIRDLRAKAKEFIANPYDKPDLPEKVAVEVPYFGEIKITKYHVISLQNDRGTSYSTYIAVQNELTAAYNELRNELAMKKFGMKYDDLKEGDPRKDAIDEIYPLRISEAEPKSIGGN